MSSAEARPTARSSVPAANFPFKAADVAAPSASAMAVLPPTNPPGLDQYRLQLYNYAMAERLRFAGHPAFMAPYANQMAAAAALSAQMGRSAPASAGQQELNPFFLTYAAAKFQQPQPAPADPRLFHQQSANVVRPGMVMMEEPKPQHSYIGLIAMAILSSADKKLVLSDIYQYILDNYAYFRTRGPGWRNSIRHNLSLNDCFIKAGRSANGKGHYWAIHPANIEDFKKGDFRRRKAQRKVRKHMGLAVDEEDSPTPPPSPVSAHQMAASLAGWPFGAHPLPGVDHQRSLMMEHHQSLLMMAAAAAASAGPSMTSLSPSVSSDDGQHQPNPPAPKKRLFDVASLLGRDSDAPEISKATEEDERSSGAGSSQSHRDEKRVKLEAEEDVDVVSEDSEDEQLRNLARESPVHQEPEKTGLVATSPPIAAAAAAAGLWRLPQPGLRFNQRLGANPATLFPAPIPPSPEQLAKYYEQVAEAMRNNCLRAPESKAKQS